ncbi:uncharacterized [Tachysurus ichikawai]
MALFRITVHTKRKTAPRAHTGIKAFPFILGLNKSHIVQRLEHTPNPGLGPVRPLSASFALERSAIQCNQNGSARAMKSRRRFRADPGAARDKNRKLDRTDKFLFFHFF